MHLYTVTRMYKTHTHTVPVPLVVRWDWSVASRKLPRVSDSSDKEINAKQLVSQDKHERVVDSEVLHVLARGNPQGCGRSSNGSVLVDLNEREVGHVPHVGRVVFAHKTREAGFARQKHALEPQTL